MSQTCPCGLPVVIQFSVGLCLHDCGQIGRGSFGFVHAAQDALGRKKYAIKYIDIEAGYEKLQHAGSTLQARSELDMLRQLSHLTIMTLVGFQQHDCHDILLFEYAPGDLLQHVMVQGALSSDETSQYMANILHGVQYLQQQNVAHRDLKLENMLTLFGTASRAHVEFSDFSLARHCTSTSGCHTKLFPLDHIAPEVRSSGPTRDYGYLVDVWACGVAAYSMLTALGPFPDDDNDACVCRGIFVDDDRLHHGNRFCSFTFVSACMTPAPDLRPLLNLFEF